MISTVIFDMDGVIVDTEPIHYYAFQQHFKLLNIEVSNEIYASFTGNSTKNVYQKIKDIFQVKDEIQNLITKKRDIFNSAFDESTDLTLLEGVETLIKDLHHNGVQLILASSSANVTINKIFEKFDLDQYFQYKISGEDFEFSKPNPAIFNHAVALSGNLKENCIVIEDSTNGIRAAKSADIFCVGYDSVNSKLQDYSSADLVISDFSELNYDIIANLNLIKDAL